MLKGEQVRPDRGAEASRSGVSSWLLLVVFVVAAVGAWWFGASWLDICVGAAAGVVVWLVVSGVGRLAGRFGGSQMSGVIVFGDGFEVIVQGRRQRIDSGVEDFSGTVAGVRVRRGAAAAVRLDGVVTRGAVPGRGGVAVSAVLEEGVTRRVGGIPMRFESARSRMVDAIRR